MKKDIFLDGICISKPFNGNERYHIKNEILEG